MQCLWASLNPWLTFLQPDIGLPVYRPDVLQPSPTHKGSLVISHTFAEPGFLSRLLAVSRKHEVKLTALLQAAMLQAVYNSADVKPSSEDIYKCPGAVDLRTNYLIAPYGERNKYVNSAVSLETIEAPCRLFERDEFWSLATNLADQWTTIKNKKGLAKDGETVAQSFISALKSIR